jgi:phosphoribosylglycinamide formyltransferase-1
MRRDLKNIAVLISGGGTNLQSLIDAIESGNINGKISIIISNRKDAYGLTRGENHNIKSIYLSGIGISQEEYDEKLLEILEKEEVDLVVLAGFLKILGSKFIQAYENKIINIHPSLIPSFCGDGYYGLKVHEKALEYGVKVSGATTHFVNEVADAGPIIMQSCVEVLDNDTPEDLQKRILKIEHSILVESVKLFCDDKLEVIGRKVFRGE